MRPGGLALAAAGLAAALVCALALPQPGAGQSLFGLVAQPSLGTADDQMVLMGGAPGAGEVWGYRRLPLSVGPPVVDGNRLTLGPLNAVSPVPQLAFLRSRSGGAWEVADLPLDESGQPYRGPVPSPGSGRITTSGGGVLVGRDSSQTPDRVLTVLARNPGDRYRRLPPPSVGPGPADVLRSGESLAEGQGSGRVADAAFPQGGRTGLFFAAVGPNAETAVAHWDGTAWTREEIEVPAPSSTDFRVAAIAATDAGNAYLLARTDQTPTTGQPRGIVLFRRVVTGGTAVWREVQGGLSAPDFEARATPADGVSEVEPLGGGSQPLTATADGAWIDGSLASGGSSHDFTVHFKAAGATGGSVDGSWCDAPKAGGGGVCGRPLGVSLSRQAGYRSFAWAGSGFGTRIVTNPLDPGGDDGSNRGTYLRFEGQDFSRLPGAGGNFQPTGGFLNASEGWLEGPVHVTRSPKGSPFRQWPVPLRAPLGDVTPEPGKAVASLGSRALAAGSNGAVARYVPGRGWLPEFLLSAGGTVARPTLRGVAWPEPNRAHAVGDLGAMWLWRGATGLWEKDPGTPPGLDKNLMDVAFEPGAPQNGWAVGKEGALLRYNKSWTPVSPPDGFASANFTSVSYAGSQAMAAAGSDVIVNSGGGWEVDQDLHALITKLGSANPGIFAVSGLPDGGAVAAGRDVVFERDGGPGSPWRTADQPLPGSTVVAIAGYRDGNGSLRGVASVVPAVPYPPSDESTQLDPNAPPPILPAFPLPGDGYLLRETANGWEDQQHSGFAGSTSDRPVKTDPVLSLLVDEGGEGWAIGGWSGQRDNAGRGSAGRDATGRADRDRVQTAGIYRYGSGASVQPVGADSSPVPLDASKVTFALGGNAACETPCSDLRDQGLAPDRTLAAGLAKASALAGRPGGPRAFLYTGGRIKPGVAVPRPGPEQDRYAELLGASGLPVFPAVAPSDSATAGSRAAFNSAFGGFAAPFGSGGLAPGISTGGIPGAAGGGGAHTHYAFDSQGAGGRVRVIVIDNSQGSLAASDPFQDPQEPGGQAPWLAGVLANARNAGIPAIVMGNKDLNARLNPKLNTASDADAEAAIMVGGGASAYVFDRPEENRTYRIPGGAGAGSSIPAFSSGTLGYRSPYTGSANQNNPEKQFGETGFLLLSVDVSARDAATNRAPVSARLVPVVDDLSLQALDGLLLRRSKPALFRGLGRRPIAGDRWGPAGASGNPSPAGSDPYVNLPAEQCLLAACGSKINPEFQFTSSNPAVGNFVQQDPNSRNVRKPFVDPKTDKPVADASSGLFCAFNAGTTNVTIRSGGLAYTQSVTVQQGSVQRPCGTVPTGAAATSKKSASAPSPAPPPAPAPSSAPPSPVPPGSPPVAAQTPPLQVLKPPPPVPPSTTPPVAPPFLLVPAVVAALPPVAPFPPLGTFARPIPPGGAVARAYQVEEKREEEAAPEQSQAFSAYHPEEHGFPPGYVVGAVLVLALAGATLRAGPRRRRLPAALGDHPHRRRNR